MNMLEPKYVRENFKELKKDYKRRKNVSLLKALDEFLKLDEGVRKLKVEIDVLRRKRNEYSQKVNKLRKERKSFDSVLEKVKSVPEKIRKKELDFEEKKKKLGLIHSKLPNPVHDKVKFGKSDKDNVELKKWGKIPKFNFEVKNHIELLENLGLVDFDVSATISGNGFYVLKGDLALLNQALLQYAIDFMSKRKYVYIEPPLMIRKDILFAALDQGEFDNSIYSIENDDLCMIGTSEHPILGMHTKEIFNEGDLPKKYFSYTMCFRKEIGSHGINEKGLWRTHQFNKVEQFIFCDPLKSWEMFDELLKNTEDFFQSLEIPYRLVDSCTGDLSVWKARMIDLEAYRPTTKEYGELTSLSNCLSFQAQSLGIKVRNGKDKELVHTLNNTCVATSRALVAIVENYQQKDGSIKVPKKLVKYLGKKVIK
ncbi:serine--tRNA ligase [archaeon]|nr:serine--tRNA ligase [archaeon]